MLRLVQREGCYWVDKARRIRELAVDKYGNAQYFSCCLTTSFVVLHIEIHSESRDIQPLQEATPASSSKKLWVVVRDLATSGHKCGAQIRLQSLLRQQKHLAVMVRLSEGDVIKPQP